MSDAIRDFNARLRRIDGHHARLDRGHVGKVRRDGLIVFKPMRPRPRLPLRGIAYVVLGVVLFKAVAFAHLGAGAYEARVARLAGGHAGERAGAMLLRPDPVSRWMAGHLSAILR